MSQMPAERSVAWFTGPAARPPEPSPGGGIGPLIIGQAVARGHGHLVERATARTSCSEQVIFAEHHRAGHGWRTQRAKPMFVRATTSTWDQRLAACVLVI